MTIQIDPKAIHKKVAQIQMEARQKGLYQGPIDGVMGIHTAEAMKTMGYTSGGGILVMPDDLMTERRNERRGSHSVEDIIRFADEPDGDTAMDDWVYQINNMTITLVNMADEATKIAERVNDAMKRMNHGAL
jgi:hypothetical protein